MLTTAEHFCDAMNARRVIRERALDEQHAEALCTLLSLDMDTIHSMYLIGATPIPAEEAIRFVDGSTAAQLANRWVVWNTTSV